MASFESAIPIILEHEGGDRYTVVAGDAGGPTKFGLSLGRFWLGTDPEDFPQLGVALSFPAPQTAADVQTLTEDQARETYRACWWDRFGYGRVDDDRCATKIFDMAVNMRRPVAHRLAQRAANDCGSQIAIDGIFGEQTVGAINTTEPNGYLSALCHRHMGFYQDLVAKNPAYEKFRAGWMQRASWPFHSVAFGPGRPP